MKNQLAWIKKSSQNGRGNTGLVYALAAVAVVGRLMPHPANVTPIGGLTVWGGTRLPRWHSVGLVVGSMFVTDALIGFHPAVPQVYITLVIITLAASWLKPHTVAQVSFFTIASSILFFLLTNVVIYPWETLHLYPPTLGGQLASYVAALPFLRNSLLGDLGYVYLFYGAEFVAAKLASRAPIRHKEVRL